MAIDKNNSKLLSDFWKENQNLILAAVSAFVNDDQQSEADRENAQNILDAMQKPKALFSVFDETKLQMKEVVQRVIQDLMGNKNKTLEEINELFKKCKNEIVIDEEKYKKTIEKYPVTDKKKRIREINRRIETKINEQKYYVWTNWSFNKTSATQDPTFPKFIKICKNIGIEITNTHDSSHTNASNS